MSDQRITMSDKWKAFLSIFVFALCLFMMIETKYMQALGDFVFESFGFESWSNGANGLHLSVLFFGALSIISLKFVRQYARVNLKIKTLSIFLSVIVLVTIFTFITSTTAQYLKSQSNGISAIALIGYDDSKMVNAYPINSNNRNNSFNTLNYDTSEFEVTNFELNLSLKNYGKNEVSFFIEFDPLIFRDEHVENIKIRNKDGSNAEFTLEPGMTQRFVVTDEMYQLAGGLRGEHSGYHLSINEVILSNSQGETVLLTDYSIFAERIIHK